MQNFIKKYKEFWGLAVVLLFQAIIYSLRIADRFVDGRFHVNWGPPFWLQKAQLMHQINFFKAYLGSVSDIGSSAHGVVATGWYTSHPQFIAIPLYIWTGLFGFSEIAIRSLPIILFLGATALWWFAWRTRHTAMQANFFTGAFAIMPVVITFASKLDQEPLVLFFVALAVFGYERFMAGPKNKAPLAWIFAIIGMMWSDWSGFIIGGLFGIALLLRARRHPDAKKMMWWTLLAGAIGVGIVWLQMWLQTRGQGGVAASLVGVYQFRSNTSHDGFWATWLSRQYDFFTSNFAGPVGVLGLVIGLWSPARTVFQKYARTQPPTLEQLCGLTALGGFVYALLVPQATIVHIYYQIFYTVAIASGLAIFGLWLQKKTTAHIFWILIAALVVGCSWFGIYEWHQDTRAGFGSPKDMDLFMQLRSVPVEQSIAVIGPPDLNAWFDNPNIVYYAGRRILAVAPEVGVQSDYIVMDSQQIEQKIAALGDLTKQEFIFQKLACSMDFCILHKIANPSYDKKTR